MRNPRDATIGIVVMAFAMAVFVLTRDFPGGTLAEGMGANFMPNLLAGILAILGLMLVAKGLLIGKGADAATAESRAGQERGLTTPVLMCVFVFLYLMALKYLGYVLATPIFLFAVVVTLGGGRKLAGIAAIGLTAAIWLIFGLVLKVPLPNGLLLSG